MATKQRKTSDKNRKFKGVWIPAKYWLDENLSINEVALITEIDSLDGNDGCWASNNHFANFLGVTRGRASQLVKQLKEKGYISIEYKTVDNITQRKIRVVNKLNTPVRKLKGGIKNSKGVFRKCVTSNTRSNTNKSNTFSSSSSAKKEEEPTEKEAEIYLMIQHLIYEEKYNSNIRILPTKDEHNQVESLIHQLKPESLDAIMSKMEFAVHEGRIYKPWPYLLKLMRDALLNEKFGGNQ